MNNMNGTLDAHRAILQNFQQGIHDAGNQRPRSHGTITSSSFPEPGISVSTARNTASNRPVTDLTSDLRHQHRPVPKRAEWADDDYSADELASAAPTTARKRNMSPSKTRHTAKGGSKQKNQSPQSKNLSKRWPLVFARTYGYERHCSNSDDNETGLSLRTDADGWRVTTRDSEGTWSSHVTITRRDFNKAQADKIGKIRLEGPRGEDGNFSIFDLQFANTPEFLTFCDIVASQTVRGSCHEKTE
jgi:sentrin-specific protease 7